MLKTTTNGQLTRFERCLEAVKSAVPVEQVAGEYGDFRLLGNGRLLGRCLSPDHTDSTPSMSVFTDTQRFKCFGCGAAGDVIDLEMLAGRHAETWTAMVALSTRYNVQMPERPPEWFRWQDDKGKIREEVRRAVAKVYQRRLYRILRDPEAHPEDDAALWTELYRPAWLAATRRVMG